mmetsp:Transcript_84738/g.148539  ORF Transcript_84738/g.148539 Transcript_84738/m.148539 type:complete len:82 (+) Transcript_84738:141-386(+)
MGSLACKWSENGMPIHYMDPGRGKCMAKVPVAATARLEITQKGAATPSIKVKRCMERCGRHPPECQPQCMLNNCQKHADEQ